MSKLISGVKTLVCVSIALFCDGVWAATPVVVWDGDFGTLSKEADGDTYTLTVNGNTVAEDGSSITIADTDSKGVYVDWTTTTDAATLIVKYRGLSTTGKTYPMGLLGFSSATFANVDGLSVNGSGRVVKAYWKNSYPFSKTDKPITMDGSETTLALRYSSAGTYAKVKYADDFEELYSGSNIMGGGTYAINGVVVGGTRQLVYNSASHSVATGMEIEGIAIFDSALTDDEIAAYEFPSEVIVEEFDGEAPTASDIARFKDASWKGTVWLKNQRITDIDFDNYANENSKIKLTGVSGYPKNAKASYKAKEIILEDDGATKAMTVDNGYSGSWSKFKKLSGSGTLAQTHGATQAWIVSDAANFSGKIDSVGKGLIFVVSDATSVPSEVSGGGVYIAEGKTVTIADGKEWGIGGAGFVVNGTLKFNEDSSATNTQVTRWNTGSVTGSGAIDLSEAKGIAGKNLRICFKGAAHDFTGDITVPANVNFVFAKADATTSAMQFSGGGYICVETTNATIGGTWTGTGVYMNGAPTTAKLKLSGGTMQVSNQFIIVGDPSFEVAGYGEEPALTITGKLFNNQSRQFAISFPTDSEPTEDETPIIQWASQQNVNASTFTSTTAPAGFDLEYVDSADFKGLILNARNGIIWQGADGASLTDAGVWNGGSMETDAAEGRFIFPANESAATVTVAEETPAIGLLDFAGMYTLTSKEDATTLNLGRLNLKTGAKLTVENLTIVVDELRLQSIDQLVLGANAHIKAGSTIAMNANETLVIDTSASLQLGLTPSFNANSKIKISNATDLVAGTYPLVCWTNTIDEISGYGLPQLDTTGYTGGLQVRLIPEAKKIWLQVISAAQAARKPLVIMPWGDSITEGINGKGTGANYRIPLCQKLSLAGYNVKTVGYWNVTPKNPAGNLVNGTDPEWCNHSGRGSERLGAKNMGQGSIYDSWANALDQAGEPDIVLLHIGINDMLNNAKNLTANEAYEYLTNVIQKIQTVRPNTKFVMSPAMCCEYGHSQQTAAQEGANGDINKTYVKPLYEKALAFFNGVQDGSIKGFDKDRLFFADMYNAVMPRWYANQPETHLNMHAGDHCHPDWAGHDLMAETWFNEIKKAFPQDANGDYHSPSMDRESALPVTAEMGAAAKTELGAFRKGFVKARVLKPTGTEKFSKGTAPTYTETNEKIADTDEIEKVGYFIEYVFPSATTNIHRWVWVDMDAFGDKTVAAVGIPTMGITQKAVAGLHVYGNHPAVFNTTADATGIEGYLDFGPNDYSTAAANGEGAPERWMNNSWDDKFGTGVYGAMQVHRKLAAGEERGGRAAQVVFAYNGWTGTGANNEFGIGNFGQHFQGGRTMDWTFMSQTATMNASVLQEKTIEIWVKVAGEPTTPTYDEVTEETPLDQIVPAEQAAILGAAGVTADKVAAWAKSKGGYSGSTTAGGAIDLEAFALGCAPSEVETTKANFKVNFDADGNVVIEGDGDFNIKPVLKHSSDLKTWGDTGNFSKAVIEL